MSPKASGGLEINWWVHSLEFLKRLLGIGHLLSPLSELLLLLQKFQVLIPHGAIHITQFLELGLHCLGLRTRELLPLGEFRVAVLFLGEHLSHSIELALHCFQILKNYPPRMNVTSPKGRKGERADPGEIGDGGLVILVLRLVPPELLDEQLVLLFEGLVFVQQGVHLLVQGGGLCCWRGSGAGRNLLHRSIRVVQQGRVLMRMKGFGFRSSGKGKILSQAYRIKLGHRDQTCEIPQAGGVLVELVEGGVLLCVLVTHDFESRYVIQSCQGTISI